jgi:hypothetical protein
MNAPICFYCGNGPTPTQGLVVGAGGRLGHIWPNEGDPGPLCPPVPSGWGCCAYCSGAFAAADLYLESRDRDRLTDAQTLASCGGTLDLICTLCMRRQPPRGSYSRRTTKVVNAKPDASHTRAAAVPASGPGLTKPELMTLWGLSDRPTRDLAGRLVEEGSLLAEESPGSHGGSPVKRYRRAAR